jgi:hypothetical protein
VNGIILGSHDEDTDDRCDPSGKTFCVSNKASITMSDNPKPILCLLSILNSGFKDSRIQEAGGKYDFTQVIQMIHPLLFKSSDP